MINTDEKVDEGWLLVPAVLSGSRTWIFFSDQQKTAGQPPGGGDGGPSLAHSDTQPPHRRESQAVYKELIFSPVAYPSWRARILTPRYCLFGFSSKDMKTSHQPQTTSSEGHGIGSHKVCVFALFLNFFLSLPQVLKQMHPIDRQWFASTSSPWHKSSSSWHPQLQCRTPSRLWTKVNGAVNGVTKGETILVVHFFIWKNTQIIPSPCSSLYEYHFTRVSAR